MLKYLDTSPKATFNIWTKLSPHENAVQLIGTNWGPCHMYEQIGRKRRIMGDLDNKERCMNL